MAGPQRVHPAVHPGMPSSAFTLDVPCKTSAYSGPLLSSPVVSPHLPGRIAARPWWDAAGKFERATPPHPEIESSTQLRSHVPWIVGITLGLENWKPFSDSGVQGVRVMRSP
jgi:hypothetical protein